jgi:hypothetical protein
MILSTFVNKFLVFLINLYQMGLEVTFGGGFLVKR